MPYLNIVDNVFVKETRNVFCRSRTINGMLAEASAAPKGPFLVLQGQTPILRKDWDEERSELSAFTVVGVPAGVETAAVFVLTMLASYIVTSYLISKALPAESQKVTTPKVGPAVFTFDGQQNIKRLNEPIECAYGKNRWYPSYLCAPYVTYVNNQAFLRVWLSLGNGNFEVEDVFVGDNRISSYPGAAWCYIQAGNGPNNTNIPFSEALGDLGKYFDVVLSPKELAGVELKAPNEENYSEVGFISVCGDNDIINQLQFNFSFPQGCFGYGLSERTVEVKITWYKESGMYQGIFEEETLSFTYATQNPQKVSIRRQLLPDGSASSTIKGKWLVKAQRITIIPDEFSGRDQVILESVTGLGGDATGYKNSALYVALQGSDTMVTDAASKINLVATRKLPVFNGLSWDTVPTRHPIWAAVDVLRSKYGAKQADTRFDLTHFKGLADKYPQVTFDHVFNQKTTIHDALRSILRVMRGTPYTAGSDYRIAVDSPYDLPVAFFGPDNAYDMNWSMVLKQELDCDAVSVSYVDPDTGLESEVQFTPHDSLGINPRKVSVVGLNDKTSAWRMAAYIYQTEVLQRDVIEFYTGLDGFIPMLGDLISVSWPFPAWGQAGIVLSQDSNTLVCSDVLEPVVGQVWIILRSEQGGVLGPYKCQIGVNPNEVIVSETIPVSVDFDRLGKDPVMYALGSSSTLSRMFRVTSSEPSETNVRITATTYDPSVFAYDTRTVPADDKIPYPLAEGYVTWIKVEENTSQLLRASWSALDNPYGYRVRYTWNPVLSGTSDSARRDADHWYPAYCESTSDFETGDVFGTTCFVRRSEGELFLEIVGLDVNGDPVAAMRKVWRASFADFAQSSGVNKVIVFKYGVGDVSTGAAQASVGYPEYGIAIPRETKVLKFYTDMPAGAGVKLQLTLYKSSTQLTPVINPQIEFVFPDTGYLEITPEDLLAKGWTLGFALEKSDYLKVLLVNPDASTLSIPITLAEADWSSYGTNSVNLAVSTYGQMDMSEYPPISQVTYKAIRSKTYVGVKAKLIQPAGREEYDRFWDTTPTAYVTNGIGANTVNYNPEAGYANNPGTIIKEREFVFSTLGKLNAHVFMAPDLLTDNVYRLITFHPYLWEGWIVPGGGGFTPKQIILSNNNYRNVKFFRRSSSSGYEVEFNSTAKYIVYYNNHADSWTIDWCLFKCPPNAEDHETRLPFSTEELEYIRTSRMVLCEWDYPIGLAMGNGLCSLSSMWGGQNSFPDAPITPGPTAYTKNIEFSLTCP